MTGGAQTLDIRYHRLRQQAFSMTWLAYAGFYLCRKNLSVAKETIGNEYALSNAQLGLIDTSYLVAYAIGQFVNGTIGDRIGGKRLVALGLIATGLLNISFGMGGALLFFLIPWTANGLAQSAGWPGCAKAFSQWFARKERGTVMGIWVTCYQVGPLVATVLATWLLVQWGWRLAFFGPALLILGFAALFWTLQPRSPVEEGLPDIETYRGEPSDESALKEQIEDENDPSWDHIKLVLKSRPIWILSLTYVVLKFIRYSLLFWLPFYMSQKLGYETGEAGYTSTVLDVAGIAGAVFAGIASDRFFQSRRAPIVVIMMILLAVAVFSYSQLSTMGRIENIIGIALIGFLLYGPDSVTSGVAAVDFGHERASAFAAGMVNGTGSIGGALSGVVVGYVSQAYSWEAVFMIFAPLCLLGAALMATMWNESAQETAT